MHKPRERWLGFNYLLLQWWKQKTGDIAGERTEEGENVLNHIGVIRKRLDVLDTTFDEMARENVNLRASGRVLADFIQKLADGHMATKADEVKIKTALRIFGRYSSSRKIKG